MTLSIIDSFYYDFIYIRVTDYNDLNTCIKFHVNYMM